MKAKYILPLLLLPTIAHADIQQNADIQQKVDGIKSLPVPALPDISSSKAKSTRKIVGYAPANVQATPGSYTTLWPYMCVAWNQYIVVYDQYYNYIIVGNDAYQYANIAANACQGGNPLVMHWSTSSTFDLLYMFPY